MIYLQIHKMIHNMGDVSTTNQPDTLKCTLSFYSKPQKLLLLKTIWTQFKFTAKKWMEMEVVVSGKKSIAVL